MPAGSETNSIYISRLTNRGISFDKRPYAYYRILYKEKYMKSIPAEILQQNIKYLDLLSRSFPNVTAAVEEVVNLKAILNLPKGTDGKSPKNSAQRLAPTIWKN